MRTRNSCTTGVLNEAIFFSFFERLLEAHERQEAAQLAAQGLVHL
jgi:hypothetical protein